jgi:hypothetical protein
VATKPHSFWVIGHSDRANVENPPDISTAFFFQKSALFSKFVPWFESANASPGLFEKARGRAINIAACAGRFPLCRA